MVCLLSRLLIDRIDGLNSRTVLNNLRQYSIIYTIKSITIYEYLNEKFDPLANKNQPKIHIQSR